MFLSGRFAMPARECHLHACRVLSNSKETDMQPDETPAKPGDEGPPDAPGVGEDVCRACRGTGIVEGERCSECNGTGKVLQGIGGG